MGLAERVAVTPPGLAVTVYEVIVVFPVEEGGLKLTTAWPLPATAETPVGASGEEIGSGAAVAVVTALDGAEGGLVPTMFVAMTVNAKLCPTPRPLTVIGLDEPVAVLVVGGPD